LNHTNLSPDIVVAILADALPNGAMLFVIMDDIIPETQSQGKARYATFAALIGFIIMMVLDNLIVSL